MMTTPQAQTSLGEASSTPARMINCLKFFGRKLDAETAHEKHFNPRSIICIDECKRACCTDYKK